MRALTALAGYSHTPSSTAADSGPPEAAAPTAAATTPPCLAAQRALCELLTETLAARLAAADPLPLLRDLNSSVQTPQVGFL